MAHFSVLHFHAYSLKIRRGRAYNELIYISLVMNTTLYVEILGQRVVERTPYYFGQIDPYGFGAILDNFKIFEKKSLKISEKVFFRDPLRGALR